MEFPIIIPEHNALSLLLLQSAAHCYEHQSIATNIVVNLQTMILVLSLLLFRRSIISRDGLLDPEWPCSPSECDARLITDGGHVERRSCRCCRQRSPFWRSTGWWTSSRHAGSRTSRTFRASSGTSTSAASSLCTYVRAVIAATIGRRRSAADGNSGGNLVTLMISGHVFTDWNIGK